MKDFLRFCVVGIVFAGLFAALLNKTIAGENDISQNDKVAKEAPCCEKDVKDLAKDVKIEHLQALPKLPNIVMMNQDGKSVRISEILKDKITVINFIYTSCTSVCQILTSNFRQLEKALESIDKDNKVQLICVSIYPDVDTPARLLQYADKQRINLTKWTLLVGGLNTVERFSRVLGFSNIDKSTHAPGVVIWDDIDKIWQRFVGITPSHILSREIAKLPAING
ncbi:MAG: SCO family protein [Candidatus Anammoxibacter sp.]